MDLEKINTHRLWSDKHFDPVSLFFPAGYKVHVLMATAVSWAPVIAMLVSPVPKLGQLGTREIPVFIHCYNITPYFLTFERPLPSQSPGDSGRLCIKQ